MNSKTKKIKAESLDSSNKKIAKKTPHSDKAIVKNIKQRTTNKKKSENLEIQHNSERLKEFQCHVCPKSFVRKEHLVTHSRVHTGERPFVCNICDYNFSDYSNLRKHLKVKHKEPKKFSCPFLHCKQTFSCRNSLVQHKKSHKPDSEQILKCDICDKKYLCRFSLSRHIRDSHASPYTCDICSKSFCSNNEFQSHEHVNTFPPKVCRQDAIKVINDNAPLSAANVVNGHQENRNTKRQTSETCFSCDICEAKFGYRRNLYTHMQELHGNPYKCDACNRSLTSSMELKEHTRVIHLKVCRKDNECVTDNFYSNDLKKVSASDTIDTIKESNDNKFFAQGAEFADNVLINDDHEEEILCIVCQKNIKSQQFWEHKMRHLRVVDLSIENISLFNTNFKQNIVKINEVQFYVGNLKEVMSVRNNLVIIHDDILKDEINVDYDTSSNSAITNDLILSNDDITKNDTPTVEDSSQDEEKIKVESKDHLDIDELLKSDSEDEINDFKDDFKKDGFYGFNLESNSVRPLSNTLLKLCDIETLMNKTYATDIITNTAKTNKRKFESEKTSQRSTQMRILKID